MREYQDKKSVESGSAIEVAKCNPNPIYVAWIDFVCLPFIVLPWPDWIFSGAFIWSETGIVHKTKVYWLTIEHTVKFLLKIWVASFWRDVAQTAVLRLVFEMFVGH